jgi:parallel beta-helix repeat protein
VFSTDKSRRARGTWTVAGLALVGSLALATGTGASPVGAAAVASDVVVKPSSLNGWAVADDNGNGGGSVSFATPLATPPAGTGGARFQLSAANAGWVLAIQNEFVGARLADLTELSYSTYRSSVDAGDNLAVTLQFPVDHDSTDASQVWQGRLVFEPYQTSPAGVPQNTWQEWDGMTGKWWQTGNPVVAGAPATRWCPQATPCDLATLLGHYPDLAVHPTFGAFLLKAGSGWAGFDGYADELTIGTADTVITYDFEAETACTSTCYVDAASGDDAFGGDTPASAKKTIQAAVNAVDDGGTVSVAAGVYNEDVLVNAPVTVQGAGAASTSIIGQIGGDGATVRVASPGVIIEGFTISRVGNTVADWNNSSLNFAGVAIQGQANDAEIRDNVIVGNRTAIDVNDSSGNVISDNEISGNHTGLLFRNTTDDTTVSGNVIADNRTVGVLFLDASGGTNTPVQSAANSEFNRNEISGNWYGQVVDRQQGGSLPAPGTTNLKNFACNWYGTATPVISTANSAEPGYASLVPVEFGGSAVAPGGQPDILGPASANLVVEPYLITDDLAGDCATITLGGEPSDASGVEGTTLTASGSFQGTGVTVTGSGPGAVTDNGDGSWSWSYDADDDETATVEVTGEDAYGNTLVSSFDLTVTNVAPTATLTAPALAIEGSPVSVSLTAPNDPSTADTTAGFEYAFDCGAGLGAFSTTSTATCTATAFGTDLEVAAQIRDKDGGVTNYAATVGIVELILAPDAPSDVTGLAANRSVLLAWNPPADDGGAAVTGYRIQVSRDGGAFSTVVANTRSIVPIHTIRRLANGAEYTFRVAAISTAGVGAFSAPSEAVVPRTVASAPRRLRGAARPSAVLLTWQAPAADGGSPVVGYRVRQSINGGKWRTVVRNTQSTATRYLATDLSSAKRYRFKVVAVTAAGPGAPSNSTETIRPRS